MFIVFNLDSAFDTTNTFAIKRMSDDQNIAPSNGRYTIASYNDLAYIDLTSLSFNQPWKVKVACKINETNTLIPTVLFSIGTIYSNTTYGGVCCYKASNESFVRLDDNPLQPDETRVAAKNPVNSSNTFNYEIFAHPEHGITLTVNGKTCSMRAVGAVTDVDTRGMYLYLGTTGAMNYKSEYQTTWTEKDWSKVEFDTIEITTNHNPYAFFGYYTEPYGRQYYRLLLRAENNTSISMRECMLDTNYDMTNPPLISASITCIEAPQTSNLSYLNNRDYTSSSAITINSLAHGGLSNNNWITLQYTFTSPVSIVQIRIKNNNDATTSPMFVQLQTSINGVHWHNDFREFTIPSSAWSDNTKVVICHRLNALGWQFQQTI